MRKFNIGDKVMGINSMYHDRDKPFYGEIRNTKSDCGVYYYEVYGIYPVKNEHTEDGGQCIFVWEHCLRNFDKDKCIEAFIKYMELNKLQKRTFQLSNEIDTVIRGKKV